MPIVISQNFALADSDVTTDHPIVGYRSIVTASNVAATYEDADYPAVNLANPATHLEWRSTADGVQYVTVTTGTTDPIDYVAIARHNLGSEAIPIKIEGDDGSGFAELVEERTLASDSPALFLFSAVSLTQIRLTLNAPSMLQLPRIAVLYVGGLLRLERKIYVGHTPLPYGRKTEVQNGRSESGNFLGRTVLGAWRESIIPLSLLSPAWYRANGDDFVAELAETPFFFAWRPSTYPNEIGYCWATEDPMPVPMAPSNRIAFDLKVSGIV